MRVYARVGGALLSLSLAGLCWTTSYKWTYSPESQWLSTYRPEAMREAADSDPAQAERWLERLVKLEPRDAEARVRLATLVEWRGDVAHARELVRQAARDDRRYRTQWARLDFERRHPENDDVWQTASRCLQMSYGDRRALIEALWELRPDGRFLLSRIIPDVPAVLYYTTLFLMEQGELGAAREAFGRLAALPYVSESRSNAGVVATAVERAHLGLDLTDLHLDRRGAEPAAALWALMQERRLVQAKGTAQEIVNARFESEPLGRGFDWRVAATSGVEMRRTQDGFAVDLGARPPERVPLLEQRVLLAQRGPGRARDVMVTANGAAWIAATVTEETPGIGRLRLEYRRPAGQPPWREPLIIRQVKWRHD